MMEKPHDAAEHSLRYLYEHAPVPMAQFSGLDHVYVFANRSYRDLFLRDRPYLDLPLRLVLPETEAQGFIALMDQLLQTGEGFEGTENAFRYLTPEGHQRDGYFNVSLSSVGNQDGLPTGILAVIYDVTLQVSAKIEAQRSAEAYALQQQKLEAVISRAPVGIAVMGGTDLRFELVNTQFAELSSSRDYCGRTWEEAFPEWAESPIPGILHDLLASGTPLTANELTIWVERRPGILEARIYDYHFIPLMDVSGRTANVLIQCRDVTERVAIRKIREESERDLVDTLESMSDAFFSVDKNWRIIRVNENHIRSSVYPRDKQIGANLLDLFFSDPVFKESNYWKAYHKAMDERVFVRFEAFYEPFDLYTEVRVYPKSDGGLAVFFTDISERKQAEKRLAFERHQLESIFQLAPAAMALWHGENFVFEKVNPEYQNIFPSTQLVGLPIFEALPFLKGQVFEEALRQVYETGVPFVGHEVPALLKRQTGGDLEEKYYDFSYVQLLDGGGRPYGVYNHAIDVTERVESRRDLEKAKIQAELANQTKSAFLANMSHEIRTPLGAILGFAELLKDANTPASEKQRFLDIILRNGKTLTRIIDDLLDLAKVESGKLETEEVTFDLYDLVQELNELFQEKAKEKGIELELDYPPQIDRVISSDPMRLRQILINIIGNAMKFTDHGGVRIAVRMKAQGTAQVCHLTVTDSGVGISKEQQERLFEPFVQADNTTSRKYGGTGLGLALSLRLAKALGGTLSIVRSELGEGSSFRLTFMTGKSVVRQTQGASALQDTTSAKSKTLDGVKILLVDDSVDNLFLARRLLIKNGAAVETATNGKEAYDCGLEGDYDVILMDIQMPIMDGYEATRELRKSGYSKPIIALTAHAMSEEIARTRSAGCNAHLTKPLDQAELVRTIATFMETPSENAKNPASAH